MFKSLRLNNKQSSKIFQSCSFNSLTCHGNCIESFSSRLRTTTNPKAFKCCDVKRNIQSISCSANFAPQAVAQERTKYETNTLPKNARVVICGGGVMGGMFKLYTNLKKNIKISVDFAKQFAEFCYKIHKKL